MTPAPLTLTTAARLLAATTGAPLERAIVFVAMQIAEGGAAEAWAAVEASIAELERLEALHAAERAKAAEHLRAFEEWAELFEEYAAAAVQGAGSMVDARTLEEKREAP